MRRTLNAKEAIANRVSLYCSLPGTSTGVRPLRKQFPLNAPIVQTSAENSDRCILECEPLSTDDDGNIVDSVGRTVTLKGINLDSAMKLPVEPHFASYEGNSSDPSNLFFDGDTVSFVGRPFPLSSAREHFTRIKNWGYNTIRYLLTWESIEHAGPGKYDDDFVDYTIEILKILNEVGGLYVFLEFHQDVWSRYSGGSGAPLWTFYAAGLNPKNFHITEAAILHNEERFKLDDDQRKHETLHLNDGHKPEVGTPLSHEIDPKSGPKIDSTSSSSKEVYAKMLWTSNYKRLAAFTMFTLLFGGKNYFPDLKINDVNIQDYLQDHLLNSMKYIWTKISQELPEMISNGTILGFESMNEPNWGLIGHSDISIIPANQHLRVDTTPTVFQSLKLGMGFVCDVDSYRISIAGPQKYLTKTIDPKGVKAWISPEEGALMDEKYGFKRSKNWKLGTCIYAQRGIWEWNEELEFSNFSKISEEARRDISENKTFLLKPNFFNTPDEHFVCLSNSDPKVIDVSYFLNHNFVEHYIKFKKVIRDVEPNVFVLLQPPVLELPPSIKDDPRKIVDNKTIYTPHYYDGMSLMFKTWNTKYNVDTLGIMRGRYLNPVLGIVFGERAIRNCITNQFLNMKGECRDTLGNIPVLMSETGMPFDMDKKKAYDNGKFYSQTAALDALSYALEGAQMHHTYWCYASINCHKWGDRWNNEDFSFWSPDDRNIVDDRKSRFDLASSTTNSSRSNSRAPTLTAIRNKVSEIRKRAESRRSSLASLIIDPSRRGSITASYPSPIKTADSNSFGNGSTNGHGSISSPIKFNPKFNLHDYNSTSITPESTPTRGKVLPRSARHSSIVSNSSAGLVSGDDTDTVSLSGSTIISTRSENIARRHTKRCYPSPDGVRAVNAVIRPYVMATKGKVISTGFDMKSCKYSLSIMLDFNDPTLSSVPTIIFVPKWHFPRLDYGDISASNGYVKYNREFEYLEWYQNDLTYRSIDEHAKSPTFKGVREAKIVIKNDSGNITDIDDDDEEPESYFKATEQYCPIT